MEAQSPFVAFDHSTWKWYHYPAFLSLIYGGMEILSHLVLNVFDGAEPIPIRGKHLDAFERADLLYINFNKVMTAVFVYHLLNFVFYDPNIDWNLKDASLLYGPISTLAMHIVYDFFYTLFHRFLHNRSVYRFVHKHHHRQRAPTRGNLDAINVHPFEFVVGEYNHLVAIFLVSHYVMRVHVVWAMLFVVMGGVLASLNHTRFNINIPGVYSVKWHDVHHRLPESNYGQYIMLWDYLMGSYKPYKEQVKTK
mmetsp:Transcript_9958/g.18134  ORF Transcript_9958/g.18134 Transcript_9958/m.18134 type:complete len:251 (+) Transcript_9958:252-1004(+)